MARSSRSTAAAPSPWGWCRCPVPIRSTSVSYAVSRVPGSKRCPSKDRQDRPFSLPKRLRYFLQHDPALIGPVLRFFLEAVEDRLKASSPGAPAEARFGAVTFVHRFGSALNANLHFHCAVIDGVFGAQGERVQFHEARLLCPADIAAVQRAARTRVLRLFARRGLIPPEAAAEMRQWEHGGGFSLEAGVRIEAADRKGLESQGQGWPCWARRGCSGCSVIAPGRSLPGSA